MTHKWKHHERWQKFTKRFQSADLSFPVVVAQQNESPVSVHSLLQPIAKKQESYIKDTTDFINLIENTPVPDHAMLVTLDVRFLYIPPTFLV